MCVEDRLVLFGQRESRTFMQCDNKNTRPWLCLRLCSYDLRCGYTDQQMIIRGPISSFHVPIPLSFVEVELPAMLAFSSLGSGVIVDVEVEREKVFARGPRCVSLSSTPERVSNCDFQYSKKVIV